VQMRQAHANARLITQPHEHMSLYGAGLSE
jgi:hypothetical protein